MPQLLKRVEPGDLITAEMWNAAVDAINQLLQGLPASSVTIAAVSPQGTQGDPIRIGTTLQITGQNFGFSASRTVVSFEGSFGRVEVPRSSLLIGSSDTRLLLIVPAIPTMTQTGMNLTLRVDNGTGSDTRSVFVAPVVIPPMGDLFLTWRSDANPNPNPNPLQPSTAGNPRSADFALRLEAAGTGGTVTLDADITNASVALPAGLADSIVFLNPDGTVIAGNQLQMGENEGRNIVVRIPQLPASFAGQTFTLEVRAAAGSIGGTFSRSFTVGTVVPPADPTITPQRTGLVVIDQNGNVSSDPNNGRMDGTTIRLRKNFRLFVMYNLTLSSSGATYGLTVAPRTGTTLAGWAVQLENTPASLTGPQSGRLVQFSVSPTGTTPASTGHVVFRIQRQGETSEWFEEFAVELLP
jgi:IPT/TIG domain